MISFIWVFNLAHKLWGSKTLIWIKRGVERLVKSWPDLDVIESLLVDWRCSKVIIQDYSPLNQWLMSIVRLFLVNHWFSLSAFANSLIYITQTFPQCLRNQVWVNSCEEHWISSLKNECSKSVAQNLKFKVSKWCSFSWILVIHNIKLTLMHSHCRSIHLVIDCLSIEIDDS